MLKAILILLFPFLYHITLGQNKAEADKLVSEGIIYHDHRDYEGAISKYDKALQIDKDNLLALAEKAVSLIALQKYKEATKYCQKAITIYPGDEGIRTVYVTYGNALDGLKKTDKAIEVYNKGLEQFPEYYHLYFNKGIALLNVRKYEEALACFQNSVKFNPAHASSHNSIARLNRAMNKRIPALLAYWRFLAIERKGNRAKENLVSVQIMLQSNVDVT